MNASKLFMISGPQLNELSINYLCTCVLYRPAVCKVFDAGKCITRGGPWTLIRDFFWAKCNERSLRIGHVVLEKDTSYENNNSSCWRAWIISFFAGDWPDTSRNLLFRYHFFIFVQGNWRVTYLHIHLYCKRTTGRAGRWVRKNYYSGQIGSSWHAIRAMEINAHIPHRWDSYIQQSRQMSLVNAFFLGRCCRNMN